MLFARCRAGDSDARAQLVEGFLPLARSLARRYESSGEPLEDLIQVACLGLVKSVDRFDPANGARFSSFAVPTILGELKRHFRDRTWAVRVPRSLNELAQKTDRAVVELTEANGRAPTVPELAVKLGVSDEETLEALQARRARRIGSLDAPLSGDEQDITVGDTISSPDAARDRQDSEARLLLEPLFAHLAERDREIVRMRFQDDMTQAEIGQVVGLSQMQISRILRRSIAQLRGLAGPDGC